MPCCSLIVVVYPIKYVNGLVLLCFCGWNGTFSGFVWISIGHVFVNIPVWWRMYLSKTSKLGAKPFPAPMQINRQFGAREQTAVKFELNVFFLFVYLTKWLTVMLWSNIRLYMLLHINAHLLPVTLPKSTYKCILVTLRPYYRDWRLISQHNPRGLPL